ncbi:thiamine-phosphate kinase [Pelagibius sp. CAU 1746]|uniref:thiamine-phosphate kinase n=1 Tax=Pelagibius sp. CAU 1746 TaxID=3140370 RepID=UPI00325A5BB5
MATEKPGRAGEFELIERYFAPLAAKAEGTFGLHNDAAVLPVSRGGRLVTTVDTMIQGRHFLDCPPDQVAKKLLRVNLSDLAAMGAAPFGYLLASAWPLDIEEAWIARFAEGLAADQELFGVALYGGDTTGTPGPMTLSLTAFGTVAGEAVLDRGSLRPDDDIYVTGTIGEGYLGLCALRGELDNLDTATRAALVARYRLPEPRLAVGRALLEEGLARSALDISDGLAADLGHLLEASGVGAEIDLPAIPFSAAAQAGLAALGAPAVRLLTGGDDYELLFAAAPAERAAVGALAAHSGVAITRIGRVRREPGLAVRDAAGAGVSLESGGWTHF